MHFNDLCFLAVLAFGPLASAAPQAVTDVSRLPEHVSLSGRVRTWKLFRLYFNLTPDVFMKK
jgi:hypothetical protein